MSMAIKLVRGPEKWGYIYTAQGDSLDRAIAFAENLQPFTTAAIQRVAVTNGIDLRLPGQSGDIQHLGLYAQLFFRRERDQKLYGLKILAPIRTMFDDDQVVSTDVGEQLAVYYSMMAGEVFTFDDGALGGRS